MVGTVSIWGWIILCCGCYPLCCRIFIFSSTPLPFLGSFPGCLVVKKKKKKKKATSKCWRCRRHRFNPWVGKIPWRRNWQPTAVFLLGKSHRWRSLVGYSPWGRRVGLSNWADTHTASPHLCLSCDDPAVSPDIAKYPSGTKSPQLRTPL